MAELDVVAFEYYRDGLNAIDEMYRIIEKEEYDTMSVKEKKRIGCDPRVLVIERRESFK